MQTDNSILGALEELMNKFSFRKHNGVILVRKNTGWQIYGTNRWHPTWEDAVKDIDERSEQISKIINQSIIKP